MVSKGEACDMALAIEVTASAELTSSCLHKAVMLHPATMITTTKYLLIAPVNSSGLVIVNMNKSFLRVFALILRLPYG